MRANYPEAIQNALRFIERIEEDMTEDIEYWCAEGRDRWAILDGFSRAKMGLKAAMEEAQK